MLHVYAGPGDRNAFSQVIMISVIALVDDEGTINPLKMSCSIARYLHKRPDQNPKFFFDR